MGNHVFVCYAREDVEFVLKLTANLKARGVTIWLDQDLPAGANWPRSIDDAIRNCAQFLIVLSPKAVESDQVQGEWLTALDEKKLIVPVIHKTCRVPPPLRSWQHVDFLNRDAGNEAALERLVRVLGGEQPARPQPPPPPKPSRKLRNLRTPTLLFTLGILMVVSIWLISKDQTPVRSQSEKSPTAQTEPQPTNESPIPTQKPVSPRPEKDEAERSSQPKESTNKPGMISIPAGDFWMGCNEKVDRECSNDEKPGREVYLDAYAIDSNEVMVAEYRRCVEAGACPTAGLTEYESCNWDKKERQNHPINCVNWQQAQTYCQWAGKRLPTEAEWEKAARGTDSRLYPWGNEWDNNKANVGTSGTTAVGSYAADTSPYRVNDMAGNVWEWVQDWYAADYYKQGPVRNPKGPTSGQGRVVRGGSWL